MLKLLRVRIGYERILRMKNTLLTQLHHGLSYVSIFKPWPTLVLSYGLAHCIPQPTS